ncbi:MAG: hypothetical protein MUE33_00955 [Cytophagaceae bacterium]|jgi:hypothetical protein|nr:hypothetical protein [Cytophagaceae bacterium]
MRAFVFKWVIGCILFTVALSQSIAQQRISGDPSTFPTEVTTMMATGANTYAIESGSKFTAVWGSFSATQQKQIIDVTQKLIKSKKLRTNPHFADYFVCLAALQSKGADQVDSMLYITSKIIETYDATKMGQFFKTVRTVFDEGYLYKSNFNTTKVTGGTPRLRFVEIKAPVFEEPIPADTAKEEYFEDWDNWQQNEETWGTEETQEITTEEALNIAYVPPPQPPVEGPVIDLTGISLTFQTPYDTATVQQTSGSVVFNSGLFIGQGGKMDWSSAGLPQAYCDLAGYNFPIHTYRFLSEGAFLHYPDQTDSIPQGVFEFNSVKSKVGGDKSFPRFKSFDSNIPVKGLDDNIRYKGGFSMSGKKIYSSSLDEGLASIEILKGDKIIIKGLSNRFQLGDSSITADYCKTIIYMNNDSIYHPGTVFKYSKSQNRLRLTKTNGFRMAPFLDSYHKIEITADACIWNINSDTIDFNIVNARNEIAATFESQDYYSLQKYAQLKGLYPFHPLQLIVGYADKIKSDEFPIQDLAEDSKLPLETLRGAMVQMMKLGFVEYNPKGGMITLKDKARHYVMSRRDKRDYDNIKFLSLINSGSNAQLTLTDQKLIVHGVKRVQISDSLNVTIEPDSNTIEILGNRDFKFNGKINTTTFQFIGKDFQFNYDSFFVRMNTIDQIKLTVKNENDTTGNKDKPQTLGNELRHSSGTLYINEPLNKSSRKKKPLYPIFDASTGASVFFNKDHIANGSYDTTMKFVIPPFRVDSLSSDDPTSIGFDGTFESGGIFPAFKEKLVVMPDNSLGFKHSVPQAGYKNYEGDAMFYGNIKVDNQGLRGNGEIHYLNTTLWSGDFVYFKDSSLTEGNQMITKPGTNPLLGPTVTFPDVHVDLYRMMWKPKVDSMYISNRDKPFEFYNQTASLNGTVIVTHGGMYGLGILSTRGSETESPKFYFEQTKFSANDATFRIKSDNPNKPALKSVQSKVYFDLEASKATFGPEVEGFASTEFPYAMYKTSLEKGIWDMNKREVYLNASDSVSIENSYFYSTHPLQDSLVFSSRKAIYKIDSLTLNIYDIPFIKVNDGKVFPDSNHVVIRENAVMQTLNDAKIEMDTINRYHHFYDATIDIYGRKKFNGQALYQYINLGGDTLELVFSNFIYTVGDKKKEGAYTVAQCLVKEEDSIYVGDKILYKGKVTLESNNQFLAFDGFIKLDLKGVLHYASWLKYVNSGESDKVTLNLENAVSEKGNPLYTGMSFNSKNYLLYTNFISEKIKPEDQDVLVTGTGFQFDSDSAEFTVGDQDFLSKKSLKGNYLTYNDNRSTTKFGGVFSLTKPDPSYKLMSSGNGSSDLMEDVYFLNVLLSLQFKTSPTPFVAIGTHIKSIASVIPDSVPANNDFLNSGSSRDKELEQKLVQIIGDDGLRSYYTKKASGSAPLFELNADFAKSILLTDVHFTWSPEYKAFYSTGKVKLSSIIKTEIEKYVDAYIEIRKTSTGDQITLYLMPANNTWYYLHYDENRLSMASSSDEVNKAIKTKGEMPDRSKFFIVKSEPMEINKFVNMYRDRYLNYVPPVETAPSDSSSMDSTSTGDGGLRKQLNIQNQDNTQQRQQDNKNTNQYQDATSDPNKYKLQQQDTQYEQPQDDPNKQKPTIEDQQQLQRDQKQLQDMFK